MSQYEVELEEIMKFARCQGRKQFVAGLEQALTLYRQMLEPDPLKRQVNKRWRRYQKGGCYVAGID